MLINLRNALMAGKKRVTFIEWLQSDGTGYVDLGFAPTDDFTRLLFTAATSSAASTTSPLVCAGLTTKMNNVTVPAFGFASINNDRQLYLRSTRQHWWNTTANDGNWNDGLFHEINIGQTGASSCSASLDGADIPMTRMGNSTRTTMPTDSQTVFASKYNGQYYLVNSKFKVRRVAYELSGTTLHDFRAAQLGDQYGFYDLATSVFMLGAGGFTAGNAINPPA